MIHCLPKILRVIRRKARWNFKFSKQGQITAILSIHSFSMNQSVIVFLFINDVFHSKIRRLISR